MIEKKQTANEIVLPSNSSTDEKQIENRNNLARIMTNITHIDELILINSASIENENNKLNYRKYLVFL